MSTPSNPPPLALPVHTFHKGDEVYLVKGSYQGTIGTFLNLKEDPKWADILEPGSVIRSHPIAWMAPKKVIGPV